MTYTVARLTNDIGVRMALGAQRVNVTAMILRETFWLVLMGAAVGLCASIVTTRWIASLLFGLAPTDPSTLGISFGVLLLVALAAGYIPAQRAARVDPVAALRHE